MVDCRRTGADLSSCNHFKENRITDSNYTHILAIVDRSGSMRPVKSDMEGALNTYFEKQADEPGTCLVDYVVFDGSVDTVYTDKPVADCYGQIEPRNMTALLDAIGSASVSFGEKLAALPEDRRPGTVLVVVVTDGYENASVEWTYDSVKALVEKQQEVYNWDYAFLGANMDAVAVGGTMGFKSDKALTFNINDPAATRATMDSYSTYTSLTRSGVNAAFSDEDRKAAKS